MARGKRGGARTPAKPAAASGPGALSQRTDGLVPSGGAYGDRKALEQQMASAPMSPGGAGGGAGPSSGRAGPPSFGAGGAFGPTQRPGEPLTAGVDWGAGAGAAGASIPDDRFAVLRAMYRSNPSPALRRILQRLDHA